MAGFVDSEGRPMGHSPHGGLRWRVSRLIRTTPPRRSVRATAATDLFKKEDVQALPRRCGRTTHGHGKGAVLGAAAIPNGLITSAMIADGRSTAGDTVKTARSQVASGKTRAAAVQRW